MQPRGGDWVCDSYTHIVYILKRTKVVKTYLLVGGEIRKGCYYSCRKS